VATIFVTDGPMMPSLSLAEQQSRLLRAQGVVNYGVGIGDLAQHALLRSVTETGGYREIDFGGDVIGSLASLGAIVGEMGGQCVPEAKLTPSAPVTPTAPPPTVDPRRRYKAYMPDAGER